MSDSPYRILIIEDCVEDRVLYRRRIAQGREQEYRFWETGSGKEGLRLCGEVCPHCVLLDYQLPDLNGLDFLDRLHKTTGGVTIPIVMLTGHGSEAVAVQAMKKGIHDYLVKELNLDGIRQVVQSAIETGLLRRQLEEQKQEVERLSAERLTLIDELRQQTAALSEADTRKNDFLAMLAHELRNPLAPLRNMIGVMQLRGGHDPETEESHAMMQRQVTHLTRLVDDLLDVSRITRGRIELRKEVVDLASLVRHTVHVLQPYLTDRGHQVTIDVPSAPLIVDADPVRLEQILTNLLNNAAKYTDPGGQLKISAVRDGTDVTIRVEDNGLGIAEDLLPHVFDLFTQGARSLDRSQGGLGIGLTLVKRLVELHGGTIRAFSAGPSQGSEFVVRLPPLDPKAAPTTTTPPSQTASAPRSLRLLVVDDNVDSAESLAILLRLEGHHVQTSYDGPTAVKVAQEELPEVVLLDIGLPGFDGFQVAERLSEQVRLGQIVLLAVTGYCQEDDRQRSRSAGFQGHLVKPVDPFELRQLLVQATQSFDR